jgi:hypothetical protein
VTFAQHGAHDRVISELGTHARERLVRQAEITTRLGCEHRELLARCCDIVGPHASRVYWLARWHTGQADVNESQQRIAI